MGLVQSGSHKSGGCVFISLQVYTNYSNFQIVIIYVYISCSRYFQNSRMAPAYGSHDREKLRQKVKKKRSRETANPHVPPDLFQILDLCLVLICMSGICSHWPPLLTSFSPRIMCSSVYFSSSRKLCTAWALIYIHTYTDIYTVHIYGLISHQISIITVILLPHICITFNSLESTFR